MAKRFTDTDKWRKPWFRKLDTKAKLVWMYLADNCDHAGIWPAAFDLLSLDVGFEVTESDLINWFGEKIFPIDDKIWIKSFFEFQYGKSKDSFNAKIVAIQSLKKLGLVSDVEKGGDTPRTLERHSFECLGISNSKGKGRGISKEPENSVSDALRLESRMKFRLEELFDLYPRPQKRGQALTILATRIRSESDRDEWERAIRNYAEHCRREKAELRHILTFPSFADEWLDWRDYRAPASQRIVFAVPD